jgi:hypothetical protein
MASSGSVPIVRAGAAALSWTKRVAAGDFDGVLDEAELRGLDAVLQHAAADDVVALADAARYRGRQPLAKRALEVLRIRFGSSPAAHAAAFLLGRMAEAGDPGGAIGWYDRYLAESPAGNYSAEALGRKMQLLHRAGGRGQARAVAQQYLRRFPQGPYVALAREILGP